MIKKIINNNTGSMLVLVLATTGLFLVVLMGAIGLSIAQIKLNKQKVAFTQALQIAEAGANYYRWVLYHDHQEYCNKTTCIGSPNYGPYGPYSYTDSSGKNIIGYYQLYITPPATNGSTIVTIKSIGWITDFPNIKRTIEVRCGIPSWSSYSTLSDSDIRFGEGTKTWGPVHSNGGIRFDGIAYNTVTSALLKYDDPDHTGVSEFGVHTHISPVDPAPDAFNPPRNVPSRPDVFVAGRSFPSTTISFNLLDNYISDALAQATDKGLVLPNSNDDGWHITLNTNDTITIKKVTSVTSSCSGDDTDGIVTESNYLSTTTPPNGMIFSRDKVWIDGKISTNRINILAFKNPLTGNATDIIINNNLTYTNYDGTDSIGLIAQRNISAGLFSADNLQIDAAMIAKEGRVGRNHFADSNSGGCRRDYYTRDSLTINGSIASRERYGFAYTDGSGYQIRNINYDNNTTYSPPPHFPTTGEYTFISWEEK